MIAWFSKLRDFANRQRDAGFLASQASSSISDLAITREDARLLLESRPDVRERMLAMAAIHGLSAGDIDKNRGTALDIALSCGGCVNEGVCKHHLDGTSKADPYDFCPNAVIYDELATEKP